LIATQVGSRESWATIDDPVSGVSGLFARGATLPGGAVIESIERGAIVLRFADATSQRVPLASGAAPVNPGPGPGDKVAVTGKPPASEYADRIRAVGDNRWEVDRTLIRELVQAGTGQRAAARGVRLQPIAKDGKLAGIKVATAREGSLGQLLGLKPGDVIESVDGKPLDSPERLMDLYARLDDTRRVDLGVNRKGASTTLIYDLP
jgi:type II secretory pathway component PulC